MMYWGPHWGGLGVLLGRLVLLLFLVEAKRALPVARSLHWMLAARQGAGYPGRGKGGTLLMTSRRLRDSHGLAGPAAERRAFELSHHGLRSASSDRACLMDVTRYST